jgi:hypothetical protein
VQRYSELYCKVNIAKAFSPFNHLTQLAAQEDFIIYYKVLTNPKLISKVSKLKPTRA